MRVMRFGRFDHQGITAESSVTARVKTSCGEVVIELDTNYPETVNSFVFLAREGYYDGTVFHRIAEGFVVQGGDPTANGRGDPGYEIADEFPPEDFQYTRGVVAMANAGKNTTGSQFFWMLADAPSLNPQFNVLGRIIEARKSWTSSSKYPPPGPPPASIAFPGKPSTSSRWKSPSNPDRSTAMGVDLHTHTTASDGSDSPAELVVAAAAMGLSAVAVTDHDTTEGLTEAENAAAHAGIELVRGLELSLEWSRGLCIC